jgi:peptidoglycan hydrolase-like protein with peptidoglycan-binding domain
MFSDRRIGLAGIAFALLTTGILVQEFPRRAAGSSSAQQDIPAFVMKNEIKKMQETLRDKGHYQGRVDGVFGLRTRAGIRAYQKAERLPITGEVDNRTASRLGIRPEWNWGNSHKSAQALGSTGKPPAGIEGNRFRRSDASRARVNGTDHSQSESEK